MNYKILVVDDEAANLRLLERLFRSQYKVVGAGSGTEALELLRLHDVALIISDQRMPVMTGIEFLKRAAEMRPHIVRIILTGYTDVSTLVEAINSGVVYKYVTKPWMNADLQQTVKRALHHYETIKSQHELKLQNERLKERLKTTRENFVKVLVEMLSVRDLHASGHARRIGNYAAAIGQHLNFEPQEMEQLSLAALLYEVANINIPRDILLKTTAPTEEENGIMKQNFEKGLQLLASVPDFKDITSVIRNQHEHWDGSGCPEGLSDEQIPLHSRIIAVAEAYDEMTAPRPLQPSRTHDEAIVRLQSAAGKKFDPEVVKIFCELKSNGQIRNIKTEAITGLIE